ncbi:iron ABC transporter permease [Roseateles sp. DAIF2]|uniref:FecCD family ABC transporter permease n=1 Tax=Roseateles sp. DAIF2 TaxID=2714952 RepID=UPI0018A271DD|nr:iron ABC transporter permease [Roseateles sp. DAIF2]QPF72901.1 iron ABC transporter permease [Roseateles sp. DAIF2]
MTSMSNAVWVWRHRALSLRLQPRRLGLHLACLALALAATLLALLLGDTRLSPAELWSGLTGADPMLAFLVQELRLPRVAAGALVGAALGGSGLLLQTLARNRLASPDLLGISDGAILAMGLSLLWSAEAMLGPWWQALLGALVSVGVILAAAGGVGRQGYRVLIIGLGLASLLRALFDLVLATLPVMHSAAIYSFSVGSLLGRGYAVALPAGAALGLLLLVLVPLSRGLGLLALGEDMARVLGLRSGALRLAVLLIAAALAGIGVSVAGPLGFVAIAAPILTRALFGGLGLPMAAAMAMGASLVLAADTLGRVWLAPVELPAGVITGMLGGPFLLWVLLRRPQGE